MLFYIIHFISAITTLASQFHWKREKGNFCLQSKELSFLQYHAYIMVKEEIEFQSH